jgi:methyl-accepting chemotaxis protein
MRTQLPMTISKVTTLSMFALLTIALTMGFGSWYAKHSLESPLQAQASFAQYKQAIHDSVVTPLNEYLYTGNASLLVDVDRSILTLSDDSVGIRQGDYQLIREHLDQLRVFIETDLRAAGKLSGNIEQLLIHNEDEARYLLWSLGEYGKKGYFRHPQLAVRYFELLLPLSTRLQELAAHRSRYIASNSEHARNSIDTLIFAMIEDVEVLQGLPLLGVLSSVATPDDDELILSEQDDEPVDIGQEMKAELRTLIGRYSIELDNTRQQMDSVVSAASSAQVLLHTLNADLDVIAGNLAHDAQVIVRHTVIVSLFMSACLILISIIISRIQVVLARHISAFTPVLSKYAEGDYRPVLNLKTRFSDLLYLRASTQSLKGNTVDLVGDIQREALGLEELSGRLNGLADNALQYSQDQQSMTEDIACAVDQIAVSINDIAAAADTALTGAEEDNGNAEQGRIVIDNLVTETGQLFTHMESAAEVVQSLYQESNEIHSVLQVIHSFADQTNLLALNASIEAARAGEAGRGFAVVADEVRQLAHKTSASAHQINEIIERLKSLSQSANAIMIEQKQRSVRSAYEVNAVRELITGLIDGMGGIKENNRSIALISRQNAGQVRYIVGRVEEVGLGAEKASKAALATAQQSRLLAELSDKLRQSSLRFITK